MATLWMTSGNVLRVDYSQWHPAAFIRARLVQRRVNSSGVDPGVGFSAAHGIARPAGSLSCQDHGLCVTSDMSCRW